VPTLTIADRGKISVESTGVASAGRYLADGGHSVDFRIEQRPVQHCAGAGPGGLITVNANAISLFDGGIISASSTATASAAAGDISLIASDSVSISDRTAACSARGGRGPGLITVNANAIRCSTEDHLGEQHGHRQRSGGDISLIASDSVSISGSNSGLFSTAAGAGPGGVITVNANAISLLDGATISASSTGDAAALAGRREYHLWRRALHWGRLDRDGVAIRRWRQHRHHQYRLPAAPERRPDNHQRPEWGWRRRQHNAGSHAHPIGFVVLFNGAVLANAFGGRAATSASSPTCI
jgi:hypothetical protein